MSGWPDSTQRETYDKKDHALKSIFYLLATSGQQRIRPGSLQLTKLNTQQDWELEYFEYWYS